MADKLGVVEFGRQLVETGDLDPVYIVLHNADLDERTLKRWLLAYWCFYHCGTASWIASHKLTTDYWAAMMKAAKSSEHPRGTERRHFRGQQAVNSVNYFGGCHIDLLFLGLTNPVAGVSDRAGPPPPVALHLLMSRVQDWKGFGPWIAFKVADMLERLGLCQVAFTGADTFLFDSPKQGAALVVEHYGPKGPLGTTPETWAFNYLEQHLGHLEAPPRLERKLNGQEFETILCKWKSHLNGHYPVGKDVHEVKEGLLRYAKCRLAQQLRVGGKKGGLWQ